MPRFNESAVLPLGLAAVVHTHLAESSLSRFSSGFQENINNILQTLWSDNSLYTYPPSASIMKISSTSNNDTSSGPGLTQIFIVGLDVNYNPISETKDLDGQTPVNTINSYLRILQVTASGTNVNQGTIYVGTGTVTAGVPTQYFAVMLPGDNNWFHNTMTVPNGVVLCITGLAAGCCAEGIENDDSICLEIHIWERNESGVERTRFKGLLSVAPPLPLTLPLGSYAIRFPPKSDIEIRVRTVGDDETTTAWTVLTMSFIDESFAAGLLPANIEGVNLAAFYSVLSSDDSSM